MYHRVPGGMNPSIKTLLYKVDEIMWEIVGASNLIDITTLEQVRKSMAMEDVPYVSVSVLFYFQSSFIVVKVCDIFAPMMFCCEVCVSLFDWTQPTCTRCCESGACELKSP